MDVVGACVSTIVATSFRWIGEATVLLLPGQRLRPRSDARPATMPWLVRLRRAVSSLQKTHCSQDRAHGVSLAALTASTLHFMTRMLGLGQTGCTSRPVRYAITDLKAIAPSSIAASTDSWYFWNNVDQLSASGRRSRTKLSERATRRSRTGTL